MGGALRYPLQGKRVWVAGHRGMLGSALCRRLAGEDCTLLTVGREDCDLTRPDAVEAWLERARPEAVFLAAARSGGIMAHRARPAAMMADNLAIAATVIPAAHRAGVERLIYVGSSAVYPRDAEQPMREDAILTAPLELSHRGYALAKLAGMGLCEAYRAEYGADYLAALPTNIYGPGDNFDPVTAHVLPGLIRRAHEAKRAGARALTVWGTGRARREFLHVEDCADALLHLMTHYDGAGPVNLGCGADVAIAELARLVMAATGLDGALEFDPSKPDGAPRKLLSVERLTATGWHPRIGLAEGLAATYAWARRPGGPLA